jgi:hypothetical protein
MKDQKGIGFIEVVIGMLVFFVTMITMLVGINTGLITSKLGAVRTMALRAAQAGVEELKSWNYDEITEEKFEEVGVKKKRITLSDKEGNELGIEAWRELSVEENSNYEEKLVTAKVTWELAGREGEVVVTTIFKK